MNELVMVIDGHRWLVREQDTCRDLAYCSWCGQQTVAKSSRLSSCPNCKSVYGRELKAKDNARKTIAEHNG